MPRPARVAVHVVEALEVVLVIVQVGSPFFLKWGLAASADGTEIAAIKNNIPRTTRIRRMDHSFRGPV